MIYLSPMFEEAELEILHENMIQKFKNLIKSDKKRKIEVLMDEPSVKEFLKLSEKLIENQKLSPAEKQKMMALLRDRKVKQFLSETGDAMAFSSKLGGGFAGAYAGTVASVIGTTAAGISGAPAIATGVVVAILLGYGGSKLFGWLHKLHARWSAQDNIRKRVAGVPTTQVQIS